MSMFGIFDIAGSGMHAETVRLNTIASNMANVDSISSNAGTTYKGKVPIFQTILDEQTGLPTKGVRIKEIAENKEAAKAEYNPGHPLADEKGYIYRPNVNVVEEMANMMDASRAYETNLEVINTTKQLALRLIQLGK